MLNVSHRDPTKIQRLYQTANKVIFAIRFTNKFLLAFSSSLFSPFLPPLVGILNFFLS